MNIIVCLDDRNGMLFNHRRQSMDKEVRKRILTITENKTLWMNDYSAKQFAEQVESITVAEDFLSRAGQDDYCFVENDPINAYIDKVQSIIVYRWNRTYPADTFFPKDCLSEKISTVDFSGNSHDRITEEVYRLCVK